MPRLQGRLKIEEVAERRNLSSEVPSLSFSLPFFSYPHCLFFLSFQLFFISLSLSLFFSLRLSLISPRRYSSAQLCLGPLLCCALLRCAADAEARGGSIKSRQLVLILLLPLPLLTAVFG